jgi:hypothetical protein
MAQPWAGLTVLANFVGCACLGCAQAPAASDASLGSTAIRLDEARGAIQPSLGATSYNFTRSFIDNVPQGENAPLRQVLRRAPNARETGM